MGLFAHIVRHLYCQKRAGLQQRQQPLQLLNMVGQPLEDSVGEQHVRFGIRLETGGITDEELHIRQMGLRRVDHVWRRIKARNLRIRPALHKKFGRIAGSTADIHHLARRRQRYLRQKIARRAARSSSNFRYCFADQSFIIFPFIP
ncbi:hypothetical protein DK52_873 [Brucella abortus]|nr:hypothetical protein DK52_873 [Brucella abortus]